MYARKYFLKELRFNLNTDGAAPEFLLDVNVVVRGNGVQAPVTEFAAALYNASDLAKTQAKALRENEMNGGPEPWLKVGFVLNGAYEFVDTQGRIVKPQDIEVVLGYRSNYKALETRQVNYDGQEMVVGGFFDKDGAAHIAFNEVDGNLTGTFEMTNSVFPTLGDEKSLPNSKKPRMKKPPKTALARSSRILRLKRRCDQL